jgi:hypothetical protein
MRSEPRPAAASVTAMLRMVLAGLFLLLAIAPAAEAATTTQILRDCADDGVLQGHYTPSELRKARQNIPADTDQYTDCRDVIARAAGRGAAGGSGGGSGSSGGGAGGNGGGSDPGGPPVVPNGPDDQKSLDDAYAHGYDPVDLDGLKINPGAAGLNAGAARNDLPTTLIVVLALLAALALAGVASGARRGLRNPLVFLKTHVGRGRA